jgi:hypothetical protein
MTKQRLNRWVSKVPTRVLFGTALVLCLIGGRASALLAPELEESDRNHNPALFPRDSHPYGSSMTTWAENWWRWVYSIPAPVNPFLSLTSDCGEEQRGPVFFIPPFPVGGKNLTRFCTVGSDKAIGVSPSTVLNDFPCPDPTFKPAPGQSLFDFLLAGAVDANGDIAEIDVTLDGEPLGDVLGDHFASDNLMFFKGDLSLQTTLDSCVTGQFQPAAVDAYFILLKPLRPGHHVLTRRVVTRRGIISGPNTTVIDVLPEH